MIMKIQVLKDGPVVEVVDNTFCPTGKGGGKDPTCGKGKGRVASPASLSKSGVKAKQLSTKAFNLSAKAKEAYETTQIHKMQKAHQAAEDAHSMALGGFSRSVGGLQLKAKKVSISSDQKKWHKQMIEAHKKERKSLDKHWDRIQGW